MLSRFWPIMNVFSSRSAEILVFYEHKTHNNHYGNYIGGPSDLLRAAPGGCPVTRLKARLKAACEP